MIERLLPIMRIKSFCYWIETNFLQRIPIYINGVKFIIGYNNPSIRIIDQVPHTTYVVGVNFMQWVQLMQQLKPAGHSKYDTKIFLRRLPLSRFLA